MVHGLVGILTQPIGTDPLQVGLSGVVSSYVKWVEDAGAIPVVIPYDAPVPILTSILTVVGGILLPGGFYPLESIAETSFWKSFKFIWEFAKRTWATRGPMAVWATCMGFQLLAFAASSKHSLADLVSLGAFDSMNESLPLLPEAQAWTHANSDLVAALGDSAAYLTRENCTMNLHRDGVDPTRLKEDSQFLSVFNVLSTNVDRNGRSFVSTIEGRGYPAWGSQWHPERPAYETADKTEACDHSPQTQRVMAQLSSMFVGASEKRSRVLSRQRQEEEGADELVKSFLFSNFHSRPGGFSDSFPLDESCYVFRWENGHLVSGTRAPSSGKVTW